MIRVMIADDQKLFRDLLSHMLANDERIQLVGEVEDGRKAVEFCRTNPVDVVLLDIDMPMTNGIEAIKEIKAMDQGHRVMILTASDEIEDLREALEYGADGYVLKTIGKNELMDAINSVYSGMEVIQKQIITKLNETNRSRPKRKGDKWVLSIEGFEVVFTEREMQIIKMIVEGKTNKEMADELFLAEGRIRNIITEIISKMMVKDRTQLAVYALKNHIFD